MAEPRTKAWLEVELLREQKRTRDAVEAKDRELAAVRAELEQAKAELAVLRKGKVVRMWGKNYAPVALTHEQAESVREQVEGAVLAQFGDGEWLSGDYRSGGEYRHEVWDGDILPGYGGFVAQGWTSDAEGFCLAHIWGLVQVPGPCGMCKKPTLEPYNCKECMSKYDEQYWPRG